MKNLQILRNANRIELIMLFSQAMLEAMHSFLYTGIPFWFIIFIEIKEFS